MTQTTFAFTTDYKNEFKRYVDELFARAKRGDLADRAERMALIDELVESYIAATGERPDSVQLDRLAALCLREELTDDTKNKIQANEYPFLSDNGFKVRHDQEVPLNAAHDYGTDGNNHRIPRRRKRSKSENAYMDRKYKGKRV
jgi:hypothetical protein